MIKLKEEFNKQFDEIYTYIENNFDCDETLKKDPINIKVLGKMIPINDINIVHFQNFIIKLDKQ